MVIVVKEKRHRQALLILMESIVLLKLLVLILFPTFTEEFSIIRIYSCKYIDMLLHKIFLKTDLELRKNLFYGKSFN